MDSLREWYKIICDDSGILLDVHPPAGQAWKQYISWESIERVCYAANDIMISDDIFIFVKGRKHSYQIPAEGSGGAQLWSALLEHELFDTRLALEAVTGKGLYCWPEAGLA